MCSQQLSRVYWCRMDVHLKVLQAMRICSQYKHNTLQMNGWMKVRCTHRQTPSLKTFLAPFKDHLRFTTYVHGWDFRCDAWNRQQNIFCCYRSTEESSRYIMMNRRITACSVFVSSLISLHLHSYGISHPWCCKHRGAWWVFFHASKTWV